MSKPPKIDRKDLKNPDEFIQKGRKLVGIIAGRELPIVPILIGVGVLVIAIYAYDRWDQKQDEASLVAYYEATKKPEPTKWEELKKIAEQNLNSRSGVLAAVDLADHAFQEAKKEFAKSKPATTEIIPAREASDWYAKALESRELKPVEKQLLLMNRAGSLELNAKWDEALSDYKSAADQGGDLKALALLGTARVLESRSEIDQAIEQYEKIAADFATTEFGKVARNHARRLRSPLFTPQKKS